MQERDLRLQHFQRARDVEHGLGARAHDRDRRAAELGQVRADVQAALAAAVHAAQAWPARLPSATRAWLRARSAAVSERAGLLWAARQARPRLTSRPRLPAAARRPGGPRRSPSCRQEGCGRMGLTAGHKHVDARVRGEHHGR